MTAIAPIEPPSITWRIIVTLVLLLICLLGFATGFLEVDRELVVGTAAGLLVLATAGVWISYFAEREAQRTTAVAAEEILRATELSRACRDVDMVDVFPSSDDERYRHFMVDRLRGAAGHEDLRLLGIACRGFLHPHEGPHNSDLRDLALQGVPMRVILLHPFFEPAVSRGVREDALRRRFEEHPDSILVTDVVRSCEGIASLSESAIEARLCPVAVGCRATFVGDVVVFEPHHFGIENQRASIDTPVFVFQRDSNFARQIAAHFEFLWSVSEAFVVTDELIQNLLRHDQRFLSTSEGPIPPYLRACRPDLFDRGPTPAERGATGAEDGRST